MTALSTGTQSSNSNHPPALEGFMHVLHQCILPNRCCHPGGVTYHLHSSDSQTTVSMPWSSITLPRAHHHRCSLYRNSKSKVTPPTSSVTACLKPHRGSPFSTVLAQAAGNSHLDGGSHTPLPETGMRPSVYKAHLHPTTLLLKLHP